MLKNYLKTGLRSLWKTKTSTFLNLSGMTLGMTCCMLILIFIKDELSFNKNNLQLNNIYQLDWDTKATGQLSSQATTPLILGPMIAPEIPQVKVEARLYGRNGQMQYQDSRDAQNLKRFNEQNIYFADSSIFKIFTLPFKQGDSRTCLSAINTVVLTQKAATRYFGTQNPVGKVLMYENKIPLKVTALLENIPANSDLQFDFLISFETLFSVESPPIVNFLKTDWTFNPVFTFCLLNSADQKEIVEKSLNTLLHNHADERSRAMNHISLLPLNDIHLKASAINGNLSTNSIVFIYIFGIIGILILLIAYVNYINLSTAKSVNRTMEVGMRKVLGATKNQLIFQFLSESLLLNLLAFCMSLLLTWICLPILNSLTGKQLSAASYLNAPTLILFALVFFCTGISGGLYPAFFITRFKTIVAIKGNGGETSGKHTLRKVLLVSQFTICMLLIIGSIVIFGQLNYLRNKPLGFKKDQVVIVPIFGTGASSIDYSVTAQVRQQMNTFADELKKFSKINDVTAASAMPGSGYIPGLVVPEGFTDKDNLFVPWVSVDYNFISALGIPLVAGRSFDKGNPADHLTSFILNESAVRSFGWKTAEAAIGKRMIRGDEQNGKKGVVIGVIKDFNFNPLNQPMQPMIMDVSAARLTQIAIDIQPDNIPRTISYINQKWNEAFPDRVFEYSFLDKTINDQYKDKESLSKIIEYFAFIAIFLSGLGLFSLSSFLAMQRTKEIGIRKVLGAGISTILILLSKDFILLVIIAFVISSPISWFLMNKWLQSFAYRINIPWWVFPLAGTSVVLLTVVTVCFQSMKAALMRPAQSLKNE